MAAQREAGGMTSPCDLMMVTAPQLLAAAEDMPNAATLRNGVSVTRAQIQKAAEILRDGPQPVCSGLQSDMPGFIFRSQQKGKSLVLNIGVLPSRRVRITPTGRVKELSSHDY
jgi:hypothetical protein